MGIPAKIVISLSALLVGAAAQATGVGGVGTRPPQQIPTQQQTQDTQGTQSRGNGAGSTGQVKSKTVVVQTRVQVQADANLQMLNDRIRKSKKAAAYIRPKLTTAQRKQLDALTRLAPRTLENPTARKQFDKQWADFIKGGALSDSSIGLLALMEVAMAGAYEQQQQRLTRETARMRKTENKRRQLANERKRVDERRAQWDRMPPAQRTYHPQKITGLKPRKAITSKAELDNYVMDLNSRQQAMGEMSQQQQLALQNAMQKQQRAMQMISNLMKAMHDIARAVIRNLR